MNTELTVETMPVNFGQLTALTSFALKSGRVSILPTEIGYLVNLKSLYIGANQIKALPTEIGRLTNLISLTLPDNELTALPSEIGKLNQLKDLILYNNKIRALPTEIKELTSLERLNLINNMISFLPSEMCSLPKLSFLHLERNRYLKELPLWIGQMPCIQRVDVYDFKLDMDKIRLLFEHFSKQLEGSGDPLLLRLNTWKAAADSEVDLTLLEQMDQEQKGALNEWLKGLETNARFATSQIKLAHMVCDLLPSIVSDLKIIEDKTGEMLVNPTPSPQPGQQVLSPFDQIKAVQSLYEWLTNENRNIRPSWLLRAGTLQDFGGWNITFASLNLKLAHFKECHISDSRFTLPSEFGMLKNLTQLTLINNRLNKLPVEMGNLSQLETLKLDRNEIWSLPHSIGKLTGLRVFSIQDNHLTALPSSIGQLTSLRALYISGNKLESLPAEFSRCTALTWIDARQNELVSFPSVGGMRNLTFLRLSENYLEYLPAGIGNCLLISDLCFENNPYLRELPMSIGGLTRLTQFNYEDLGPDITQEMVYFLHALLKQNRAAESVREIMGKLLLLKTYGGSTANLQAIDSYTAQEKADIYEWLTRLEKTNDFARAQAKLAALLCRILQTVVQNETFRELFFVQIAANNECCQDRAAMALCELYTSWLVTCMPEETPLQEKLQVLKQAAMTIALRAELGKIIPPEEAESVEIYLYYEVMLKERLNLLTPIDYISYPDIGKRAWIDPQQLVEAVNKTYISHLAALPAFEKIADQELKEVKEKLQAQAEEHLSDCPPGDDFAPEVLDWKHRQGQVKLEFEEAWKAECLLFLSDKLKSYEI